MADERAADGPRPGEHHALLVVEYDGTPFYGWSRQPGGVPTVEAELRAGFERLRCPVRSISCAGRTDAGVHAVAQVVGVRYDGGIEPERIARAITGNVRHELAVVSAVPAPAGFDPRGDATSRAYEYRVLTRRARSPVRAGVVLHHPRALDVDALDAAAQAVTGQHDFTAFTPSRTKHAFFDRTVHTARWVRRGDELVFQVRANAFLRHMVRVLVGSMLAVGRGDMPLALLRAALDGAPRSDVAETAPPHGLCFVDVTWEPVDGLPLPPGWTGERVDALRDLAHLLPRACAFPVPG